MIDKDVNNSIVQDEYTQKALQLYAILKIVDVPHSTIEELSADYQQSLQLAQKKGFEYSIYYTQR